MKHKNAAHTYKKQAIPFAGPIAVGPLAINHIDQMILTDNLKFALCDTNEVFRVPMTGTKTCHPSKDTLNPPLNLPLPGIIITVNSV